MKRATQNGGPYTPLAQLISANYTDNSVTNGTTYFYVIAAINSLGDGTNSLEAIATPSLSASLKTWFAADAINGLANGAAVSNWTDISGNGTDATQTVPSKRPVYVANAMNNLPVVRFNAANSNLLAFARPVQEDFTILCAFRSTQGFGSGNLYYQGAGLVNGEVSGSVPDFGACLFANGQICAGTGSPDVAVNSTAGFNDGLPHLMTFKRIEGTGKMDLYMDGVFMGQTTGSTSALLAPSQLVLGALQTGINFFSGDMAEVQIFDSALNDTDRAAQESALIHKWGIPSPPAPTGLTATAANGQVQLNWIQSSTVSFYKLKRSTVAGGPYTIIASPGIKQLHRCDCSQRHDLLLCRQRGDAVGRKRQFFASQCDTNSADGNHMVQGRYHHRPDEWRSGRHLD